MADFPEAAREDVVPIGAAEAEPAAAGIGAPRQGTGASGEAEAGRLLRPRGGEKPYTTLLFKGADFSDTDVVPLGR